MNNPRVNLLHKNEQRYQGAVSRKFLLISIVVTPIIFIAMLSGVKLIQFTSVQSELKASREIWADLEPQLVLHQTKQRDLATNLKALELVKGWKTAKVSPLAALSEIQDRIPENIQLTRMSIKSAEQVAFVDSIDDTALTYRLNLQGQSQGLHAEDAVLELSKDLLAAPALSTSFESIKLVSMRKRAGLKGENIREFSLEGHTKEEE